jgi:hypothetical protein
VDNKRLLIPVLAIVLTVVGTASALAAARATPKREPVPRKPLPRVAAALRVNPAVTRRLRSTARRWEIVMGRPHRASGAPLHSRRALRFWRRHAHRVLRLAAHPPHKSGWLCIHRFEGSWTDSGDPYWGGLQMDRGFMRTYAPMLLLRRGLANRWTALEQMWVAERAHRSGRGYWPWPSTARACGLL